MDENSERDEGDGEGEERGGGDDLQDVTRDELTCRVNVVGSCAVSAERVTPLNRKFPSSLVALSDNCHNFVLRKIKRSQSI